MDPGSMPDLAGCQGGQAAQGLPLSVDYEPGLLGVVCMCALGVVRAVPRVWPHIDGLCAGCRWNSISMSKMLCPESLLIRNRGLFAPHVYHGKNYAGQELKQQ